MAHFVFKDAFFSIGGTDVSCEVKSITINASNELQDNTTICQTARARVPGLNNWTATVEFFADFDNAAISETLWNVRNTSTAYVFKPRGDTTGANNPKFTGSGFIPGLPIGGGVGEISMHSITIEGDGELVRAESD